MNYRITEAKNRLKIIIKKHERQKSVQLTENILSVIAKKESFWLTIFLLCFLFIFPVLCILYFIYSEESVRFIGFFVLLSIGLSNILYRIFLAETSVEINFAEKCLTVQNTNCVLGKYYKTHKIPFSDIYKSELKVKSYYSDVGTVEWLAIYLTTKKGKKHLITNFDNKFPETLIAKEVNIIIELIKNEP